MNCERLYWKIFSENFGNRTPLCRGGEVWNLRNRQISQNRWLRHASWCSCFINWLSVCTFMIMADCSSYKVAAFKSSRAEISSLFYVWIKGKVSSIGVLNQFIIWLLYRSYWLSLGYIWTMKEGSQFFIYIKEFITIWLKILFSYLISNLYLKLN